MTTSTDERVAIGGITVWPRIEGQDTGGMIAIHEFAVRPGTQVPAAHSHDNYDETLYGVEGALTMTVNGATTEVGPGDTLFIPRGVVHHFENVGEVESRTLAVITPGILGAAYFREIADVLSAAQGGPPDLAAIGAVMRRHGLTPAP